MKRLLAILTTSLVLMPEVAYAKGKGVGSCAQAVSKASVQTLHGTAIIAAIVLLGVWIVSVSLNSRRKDRELKDLKGDSVVKTGNFGHP